MNTASLCEPLKKLLESELEAGNEITEVLENGWSKIDLIVYLKYPFKNDYRTEAEFSELEFYRQETDPHYDKEDSYSSPEFRQAIAAPINEKYNS